MGREDVKQALGAMDDEGVRQRLSEGDFAALGKTDLTEEEKTLVQDAAGDYPEVAGFAFDAFLKLGDIKGESTDDKHKDWIEAVNQNYKWTLASNYVRGV